MSVTSTQVRLAKRPMGLPGPDVWDHTTEELGDPADGQVLVRVEMLSLDPAMRGWMNEGKSYIEPVEVGAVMRAGGLGEVIASAHPDVPVGAKVSAPFGVQTHALVDGAGLQQVSEDVAPLPTFLGTLGMTGMTAYFGLLTEGQPKEGDTVVVSGAAGAVGMVVGQIAKVKGCRVVGIAGGAEKCAYLVDELGFDAAIDYKAEHVGKALRKAAPDGIDVYFDNVGGDILDDALAQLARGARVVICGAISQYNATSVPQGPKNYLSLLVNRASMKGMVVFDYAKDFGTAAKEMGGWLASGELKTREDVVEGDISDFPDTLLKLFRGENTGKLILKLR